MEDTCVICADCDELYLICLACKKYTSCKKCYKKFVATKTICPLCDNTLHNRITEWDKLTKSLEQSVLDTYIKHEMSIICTKHLELEEYLKSLTTINDEIAQRNAKTIISDQQKTIRGRIKYEVEREIEYVLDFVYYSTVGGVNAKLAETTAKIVGEISEMLSVEYIKSAISLEKITHIMNVEYIYGYPFSVIDKMDMDLLSDKPINARILYDIMLNMAKRFGDSDFKACETIKIIKSSINYSFPNQGIVQIISIFIITYRSFKNNKINYSDSFHNPFRDHGRGSRQCTFDETLSHSDFRRHYHHMAWESKTYNKKQKEIYLSAPTRYLLHIINTKDSLQDEYQLTDQSIKDTMNKIEGGVVCDILIGLDNLNKDFCINGIYFNGGSGGWIPSYGIPKLALNTDWE
jgi:hypothetical protein